MNHVSSSDDESDMKTVRQNQSNEVNPSNGTKSMSDTQNSNESVPDSASFDANSSVSIGNANSIDVNDVSIRKSSVDVQEDEENEENGSDASSPLPLSPHKSKYTVQVLPNMVSKDGELLMYTVQCTRLFSVVEPSRKGQKASKKDQITFQVKRQYEDFEYLDHCLTLSAFPGHGLIVPPLPPKSACVLSDENDSLYQIRQRLVDSGYSFSPHGTNASSKKLLITPRDWYKDCYQLEMYLKAMIGHPVFGKNIDVWERFLTAEKPAPRVRVKKNTPGLISRIGGWTDATFGNNSNEWTRDGSNVISGTNKVALLNHRDCEEYFQKEKDWNHVYSNLTRECLNSFNSRISARISEFICYADIFESLYVTLFQVTSVCVP